MSMKSWGHTLRGEALSIETTPVGVGSLLLTVDDSEAVVIAPVSDSGGDRDGQHSGRSSLHPTRGTSIQAPPDSGSLVKSGMSHGPSRIACPVYATVGSRSCELDVVVCKAAVV